MSKPRKMTREMERGDTLKFEVPVVDENTGLPVDITGFTAWATFKKTVVDTDNQALAQLSNGPPTAYDSITFTDAVRGKMLITMNPIVTRGLPDGLVDLVYDVQVKDGSGSISTVEKGTLSVEPDVTRAIT